jgi:NAD(P)H-flavin reductase
MIPEKLRILTNYKATEYSFDADKSFVVRAKLNQAFIVGAEFMLDQLLPLLKEYKKDCEFCFSYYGEDGKIETCLCETCTKLIKVIGDE